MDDFLVNLVADDGVGDVFVIGVFAAELGQEFRVVGDEGDIWGCERVVVVDELIEYGQVLAIVTAIDQRKGLLADGPVGVLEEREDVGWLKGIESFEGPEGVGEGDGGMSIF